ncbi:MAG: preprotein translocase subunit SecE [Acidobacteria bacterium]|nr:preprotein translocase subunit SecE [Acidobacteriota bacterium]
MATQVAKVEEEKQPSQLQQRVSGSLQRSKEFIHDVRVELKKVTWPNREDVTSTTGVVIVTVAFFGAYLAIVEWLAQKGLDYILKLFHVA